jgi:hypothetical protein
MKSVSAKCAGLLSRIGRPRQEHATAHLDLMPAGEIMTFSKKRQSLQRGGVW